MDMSKYREMFLTETGEHLKIMGQLLVALEKDPADREGIDALFREAHSVKGMAASMGYERTAELSHYLEDLMDGFRKGGEVPAAVVDRLFVGFDLLESLVEDITAGRAEREVAGFISGAQQGTGQVPPAAVAEEVIAEEVGESTPQQAAPGQLLHLVVEMDEGASAPAARAMLILMDLATVGKVISSSPDVASLQKGGAPGRLEVRLQTDQSPVEVTARIEAMADVARVSLVEEKKEPGAPMRRDAGSQTVRVATALLDRFVNLTGELITTRYMLQTAHDAGCRDDAQAGLGQLARLITDLHHQVLQVRMMPLESIVGRLPRLVRDLARKSGKVVTLRLEGVGVELDRAILEQLADPLVHMVRNAIDHGIETSGEITVRAWREKDLVLLEVADDGRGIDPAEVRKKALDKGLISAVQASSMALDDLLSLICRPGFSTAGAVTETSGRGVGMDVVKAAVEALGGTLDILSRLGEGTRMRLHLPLSVAIIRVLLVECDGHTLGIPITRVLRTLEATREEIQSTGRQMVLRVDGELVPLLSLRKMLQLPGRSSRGSISLVLTEARGRRVALVVDRLLGQREAFIKGLEFPLAQLPGIGGATILGDGSVIFVIDPQSLLEVRSSAAPPQGAGENS